MIDKIKVFMTLEDAFEALLDGHLVPDKQLKVEIITLLYNGADEQEVWDYINSYDDE